MSRVARLFYRQGKGPARPYVNIESCSMSLALVLIKNTLKRWVDDNTGFGILIGGPGARAANTWTNEYFIRCLRGLRLRSSGRSCVVDTACYMAFLLLGDAKALSMSSRFIAAARRASQRALPH